MNYIHNRYSDIVIITISGFGEYGDDVKLKNFIEKFLPENISTVAINFSQVDTINSAAIAALINLIKYGDEHNFDVVFFGANDKIYMILERALPKYSMNILTEDELYKRYNINI